MSKKPSCLGFTLVVQDLFAITRVLCFKLRPQYLIDDLERVQKRALSIICPTLSYDNALASLDLELLVVHHQRLCQSLFNSILEDTDHRLRHLLPVSYSSKYSLRHPRAFDVKFKAYRARNCFINSQCLRVKSLGQPSDF